MRSMWVSRMRESESDYYVRYDSDANDENDKGDMRKSV